MEQSAFNPEHQQENLPSKIVVGLERISEAFKALLWQHAKTMGLSPIQLQMLLFVAYHAAQYCTVSYLSQEFNVTKPTVSDAVKALEKKGLIEKDYATADSRSYRIRLSEAGRSMVEQTQLFAQPVQHLVAQLPNSEQQTMYATVMQLVSGLNKAGVLTVQRTCFACRFYEANYEGHHCRLLQQQLQPTKLRLDCPEFEPRG